MPDLHVRNVPQDLVDKLKVKAARERRTLSAQIIRVLEDVVTKDADGSERLDANDLMRLPIEEREKYLRRIAVYAEELYASDPDLVVPDTPDLYEYEDETSAR